MAKIINEDLIPFRKFINIIFKNWQWFLMSLTICLLVSLIVNRYSTNIYSNSIKINLNNNYNEVGQLESILDDWQPIQKSDNLSDKIFVLTSYPLVYKTVNDLGLYVEYFLQGNIK